MATESEDSPALVGQNQVPPPPPPTFLYRLWRALYGHPYLLLVQCVLSLALGEWCAYEATGKSKPLGLLLGLSISYDILYLVVIYCLHLKMDAVKNWCRHHWVYLRALQIMGIIGVLRLFVFISAVLEKKTGLDGYSTSFFLLSYFHVISLLKLFNIDDVLCLSDSLLAIAIMVAARLDHVTAVEETCHIHARINEGTSVLITNGTTVPVNGAVVSFQLISAAGFVGHETRTVFSYLCAAALVCFRISKIPYVYVKPEADANEGGNAGGNARGNEGANVREEVGVEMVEVEVA